MSDCNAAGRCSRRYPVGIVSNIEHTHRSRLSAERASETTLTTVKDGLFRIRWIHAVLPLFGSDADLLLKRSVVFVQSRTVVPTSRRGQCET